MDAIGSLEPLSQALVGTCSLLVSNIVDAVGPTTGIGAGAIDPDIHARVL
jgi:hypothetical protein